MFKRKRIPRQELLEFNKSLALMLYAQIGFVDAMDMVYSQLRNERFKAIIKDICKQLKTGAPISKSFGRHPELFNELFIATLKVGEETGEIASVISEYTQYSEKIFRVRQKALVAIRYPFFVIFVAFCTLFFMIWFLIPSFEGIFVSFGKEIPAISQAVFSTASFIRSNSLLIMAIPSAAIFIVLRYTGRDRFRRIFSIIIPRIPLASKLYKTNIMSRFSYTMNTLLKNRVTLVESLKIARASASDPVFLKEIDIIVKSLIKGQNFSGALGRSKFFEPTFVKLLTAAEGASELDKAFLMTAEFYTNEFDDMLETITSFMEPALILFIGLFVGTIVVALYLPMFELLNNFGF